MKRVHLSWRATLFVLLTFVLVDSYLFLNTTLGEATKHRLYLQNSITDTITYNSKLQFELSKIKQNFK